MADVRRTEEAGWGAANAELNAVIESTVKRQLEWEDEQKKAAQSASASSSASQTLAAAAPQALWGPALSPPPAYTPVFAEAVRQWCDTQMPQLGQQQRMRIARVMVRAGFNPMVAISAVQEIYTECYGACSYRLEFNTNLLPRREFSEDPEYRQVLGAHCTTCEGFEGIIKDMCLKGSKQLPHIYFKGWLDGYLVEHMKWLFENAKDATKNMAGIVFELVTKGLRIKSHTDDCYAWVAANGDQRGTYWDQHVCFDLRQISHFKSGDENRWSAHPELVQLRAFWVSPVALERLVY